MTEVRNSRSWSSTAGADSFVKYPRTPHLVWLGASAPRNDKVMSPAEVKELMSRRVSIEEKVDGANLGISVGPNGRLRAQSRGHYLEPGTGGQWKPLWRWLAMHQTSLVPELGDSLMLFGEWCYAEHSVFYDALPDWLLVFDVYDRSAGRFWSRRRRDAFVDRAGLALVPRLEQGVYTVEGLSRLLGASRLGSTPAEGIYLRWDDRDWLSARAKMVRRGWVMASDEHWSARPLRTNRLEASADRTSVTRRSG